LIYAFKLKYGFWKERAESEDSVLKIRNEQENVGYKLINRHLIITTKIVRIFFKYPPDSFIEIK
jgi:hypothetical protein